MLGASGPPVTDTVDTDELRAPVVRPAARMCRAIELIEAESAYSQHSRAPASEIKRLGMHAERIGSGAAILTRKSVNTMYNKLVGIGQASPATSGQVEHFLELAREQRVAKVSFPLGGSVRPRALPELLESHGCRRGRPGAKLWRGAGPLTRLADRDGDAPSIRICRVSPTEASLWVDVVAQVWRVFASRRAWFEARAEMPGWHHYLASVDDVPAGAAALYVGQIGRGDDAMTVGHLVDGVTLKRHRRIGVQHAIIRRRIMDGQRAGCELFTCETAPPLPRQPLASFRNLRREGFELAYLRYSWDIEL